ncbi:MAG: FumA C-terminus/TtdB family hydratase beta subunit [Thermodesulfobacteriota bacterium]|nr:FumA C-terminus/TtdB family hydratase beta subunit [Thermodesulfobacteriota bacterium]
MAQYTLTTPLTEEMVRKLRVRDTVILNGTIFGIRDLTLIHIFDRKNSPPVSLQGAVLLHTAPSLKKVGDRWEKICVGTTTSGRMDRFTPGLMENYGVRAIIGKGGQYEGSLKAMKKFGGCYLAIVGGAAAVETKQIVEVEKVYFEELHPEALYQFKVKDFGPLIVAMDSHGNHLYFELKAEAKKKLPEIYERLGIVV